MTKKYIKYFYLFFCLTFLQSAIGQEYGMWHITDEDGLPSMTVYGTVQDKQGYVWMGTENGVCRFDGMEFKSYKSNRLNDNEILKIETDTDERVWFKNLAGQLFFIENEEFYNAEDFFDQKLPYVQDFIIEKNAILLSLGKGSELSLAMFSLKEKKGASSFIFNDTQHFCFFSPFIRNDESIFILARLNSNKAIKLLKLDLDNNELKEALTFSSKHTPYLRSAFYYNNELYLRSEKSSGNSIFKWEQEDLVPFIVLKPPSTINDIIVLEDLIWIKTTNGILIQSMLTKELGQSYLLDDISTNHLMIDHEGNKWISTTGQGVFVINAPQSNLYQVDNSNLLSNDIYSLEYDLLKKRLIIGHGHGLISILDDAFNNQVVTLNVSGRTLDILIDHKGNYWCSNDRGLFLIDHDLNVHGLSSKTHKYCFESYRNEIWGCTYNNVFKIEAGTVEYNSLHFEKAQIKTIVKEKSYALVQDILGDMWVGTINGIFISKRNEVFPFLENEKHVPYNVATMVMAHDSVIWVGTRGDGLLGIKNEKIIYRFNEEDGLASNNVKCLFATEKALWIGTDNGLSKFLFDNEKWEWIQDSEGLPSKEINAITIVNGEVWVGTAKGLINFSENANHINNTPPPIYITRIQLEDRDTVMQDSFYLSYDQNSIQVDFTGIGFRGEGEMSYTYKLSGVDDDWIITNSGYVRYPNLKSGNYRFEVFALNEDQIKSVQPASIYFVINPPWWKTWWFSLLSMLIIVGILSYLINDEIQKRKRKREFLEQVNELKTMALRSQMNPHFIFNAMNAIQKFLTTNNREQAMNYLSRFGKLIRSIFEQSQKEAIPLAEELEFLNLYLDLEKLRFMDRVDIQMEVSTELQNIDEEIFIPPLIIQPIIENSFKHGFLYEKKIGVLKVNFTRKGKYLFCSIEDNGIGRKKAAELGHKALKDRSSSGLKTARERLKIYNSENDAHTLTRQSNLKIIDLLDENKNVKGTLVQVEIYCKGFEFI